MYTSVLPLPVTPCIRNLSCSLLRTAALIRSRAHCCSSVRQSTRCPSQVSRASGFFLSRLFALLPAGTNSLTASMNLHRYLSLIHAAVFIISSERDTSSSTDSTILSLARTLSSGLSAMAATYPFRILLPLAKGTRTLLPTCTLSSSHP